MPKVNLTIIRIDFSYSTVYSSHRPFYIILARGKKLWDVGFHVKPNDFNLLTF